MAEELIIEATPQDTLQKLASYFVEVAKDAIVKNQRFSVALSGGSSPKAFYELLCSTEWVEKISWDKVYFFFGDERYVPQDDPASNYLMVKTALFDKLQVSKGQVFAVDTTLPPEIAAPSYMKDITNFFEGQEARIDLVLLGLGDNSHTASLFPDTDILFAKLPDVAAVFLADQQVYRISFTAPLINQAKNVAFLVYGVGKAEAVYHILRDKTGDFTKYPARLIMPKDSTVKWFIDSAAANMIKD